MLLREICTVSPTKMRYSGVFAAITALSGMAAALPRPLNVSPSKGIPIKSGSIVHTRRSDFSNAGEITRRALDSGARVLKPIKVHPSFMKREVDEDGDSIDFSRLDLSKQVELVYGAPECE